MPRGYLIKKAQIIMQINNDFKLKIGNNFLVHQIDNSVGNNTKNISIVDRC